MRRSNRSSSSRYRAIVRSLPSVRARKPSIVSGFAHPVGFAGWGDMISTSVDMEGT